VSFEDQPPASALPVLRPGAEPGAAPLSQLSADPLGAARAENEEDSGGSFGLWKIHSMLRGRYLILSLVGLLTGGMAAVVGWRSAHPIYFSEGLIRIAYSLPVVEKQTDENAPMPMFTEFMQSQAILIKSRRAIDSAVVNPVWKAMGQTVPDPADQYYAEHLNVEIRGDSEMIRITVRDQQPVLAAGRDGD
jgi:capsular polysaccharide biosynthesis protein